MSINQRAIISINNAITSQYYISSHWNRLNILRVNYILITNLMQRLLFIHKILFSSTCFEPKCSSSGGYNCIHAAYGTVTVACRYTDWVRTGILTQSVYRQATTKSQREWQYHMLHVYNCILLKMNTWGSKHVEENNILWINNNQCTKVGN